MQKIVEKINADLPLHSLWDGFWVRSFKRRTLVISGSLDRIYYRDYDIVFKRVTFFNVPNQWRDSQISGKNFFRLASKEEFLTHHLGFEPHHLPIFAIDIHYGVNDVSVKFTFFIVAKNVYLNKCEEPDNDPGCYYTDTFETDPANSFSNKVVRKQ